jgi:hypothetical protein
MPRHTHNQHHTNNQGEPTLTTMPTIFNLFFKKQWMTFKNIQIVLPYGPPHNNLRSCFPYFFVQCMAVVTFYFPIIAS